MHIPFRGLNLVLTIFELVPPLPQKRDKETRPYRIEGEKV